MVPRWLHLMACAKTPLLDERGDGSGMVPGWFRDGSMHTLDAYFSWHGPGSKGVYHRTTDSWVFQGARPRVDKNTEARGPWLWLRATQHGHFYVQVKK